MNSGFSYLTINSRSSVSRILAQGWTFLNREFTVFEKKTNSFWREIWIQVLLSLGQVSRGYWQPLAAIWGCLGADKYCFWYLATNPGCCRGWRCPFVSQIVKITTTKCLWTGRVGSRWIICLIFFCHFFQWKQSK